jgi:hypothetical protein
MTTYTHGHNLRGRVSRTYRSWSTMKIRCDNPKDPAYSKYGGRGIIYDPAWKDFTTFLEDMGERPEGTTLDRKDNNGPYTKDNCRWATHEEQANNRRNTWYVEWQGRTQSVRAWADELGMTYKVLSMRLLSKWTIERAMTTPYVKRHRDV